jgi:hypothetical protein
MQKTIETHLHRKFHVKNSIESIVVEVKNTSSGAEIVSSVLKDDAFELGEAMINAAGKRVFLYIGRPPSACRVGDKIRAGLMEVPANRTPDSILEEIKSLITIREVLILEAEEKKKREAEAAKKLEERRNKLAIQFGGDGYRYHHCSHTAQAAIDRIIELEDKLNKA